jgi:hypothetical protein
MRRSAAADVRDVRPWLGEHACGGGGLRGATIGTMVVLVLPAHAAIATVRGAWADRWGDALAGALVALVGILVTSLGV